MQSKTYFGNNIDSNGNYVNLFTQLFVDFLYITMFDMSFPRLIIIAYLSFKKLYAFSLRNVLRK